MGVALVVVDMLNSYEHEDADPLMDSVREVVPGIRELLDQARQDETLIVYVNDNSGDWSAGRPEIVDQAMEGRAPELIEPRFRPPVPRSWSRHGTRSSTRPSSSTCCGRSRSTG
jgi:nicotinamidase-related amidase